jgi:integrase/recombinase XerD
MLTDPSRIRVAGVAPPASPNRALELMLERYRHYLTVERGLQGASACNYADAVRPFLYGRLSSDGRDLDLKQLKLADVIAFVVARCPHQSRGAAAQTVTALRSLLGFLYVEGTIERGLSMAVPKVAAWRLTGLPRGLEPTQVERLLASCDRRTARGRRDFAIVTTLVRLGLRSGEVAALTLDDIDWRAGEIVVHGKGNRAERLPLPVDVGEAIAGYLRRGRTASAQGRAVFVRLIAPHCGLGRGGVKHVVSLVAARRAARCPGARSDQRQCRFLRCLRPRHLVPDRRAAAL